MKLFLFLPFNNRYIGIVHNLDESKIEEDIKIEEEIKVDE